MHEQENLKYLWVGADMNPRLIDYVPKHLHAKIIALSKKQGIPQSSVIEDALAVNFSISVHHEHDATLIWCQDDIIRQLARIERDQNGVIEMADMLTFYQLASIPGDSCSEKCWPMLASTRMILSRPRNGQWRWGEMMQDYNPSTLLQERMEAHG